MYKNILIILIFVGILCMVIALTKNEVNCPEQKVIYRYIPRTFEEEQEEPVYVSDIFNKMFTEPSPWVGSVNEIDDEKLKEINKFFVSQI
jgi:hypothetical protein